jgi:transposase
VTIKKNPYSATKIKKIKSNFSKEINVDPNKIISIDETSIEINSKPLYGWSKKNTPCRINIKKIRREKISLVSAISNKKVIDFKIVRGSVNGEIFKDFIIDIVLSKCNTNVYLLMDNARIHHYKRLKESINNTDNKIIYNIPYNPETNPIELVFSNIKNYIKRRNNDNLEKLRKLIVQSFKNLNSEYLNACYKKALGDYIDIS